MTIISKLHKAGIAHRGIRLEDILVTRQGDVKLIDFGYGTYLQADGTGFGKTRFRLASSLPPELLAGSTYQAQDLDVFSCATSMFQCRFACHIPWRLASKTDTSYSNLISSNTEERDTFW